MSPAFLAAIGEKFPDANVTVDWFHVVQLFNIAVDEVRRPRPRSVSCPRPPAGPCSKPMTAAG
ncbi:hypothetical protein DFAR_1390022 [Desulfarculales bacterium]